jgi:undecaprenyl-diphosphatase
LNLLQAILLGLVQGLGEFLPISSSAHLVIVPWFFGWPDPGLTFDIALHMGTLVAVLIYFWKDWLQLLIHGFSHPKGREGRLFWYLVLASIPGAVAGLLLEKKAETIFREPLLIACMLIVMGSILFWADRKGAKKIEEGNITLGAGLLIGMSQSLAIIPGVSRSGVTMTAALMTGLTRKGAARFSFLLSTPIIFGAALVKLPYIISNPSVITMNFFVGMLVSFVTGIASIGFLLRYVSTKDFLPFVWYRFALGALIFVVALVRYMK